MIGYTSIEATSGHAAPTVRFRVLGVFRGLFGFRCIQCIPWANISWGLGLRGPHQLLATDRRHDRPPEIGNLETPKTRWCEVRASRSHASLYIIHHTSYIIH